MESSDGGPRMIVGLGNPGPRYDRTPHNAGFLVVDTLASEAGSRWRRQARWAAEATDISHAGGRVFLLKPQTFMNNSGQAVAAAAAYWKITHDRILIVLDDADLAMGRVRFRGEGGSGGHRGLASVIAHLGHQAFPRLRVGVGRDRQKEQLADHVLSPFSAADSAWMDRIAKTAAEAAMFFLSRGVEWAMNEFNGVIIEKET